MANPMPVFPVAIPGYRHVVVDINEHSNLRFGDYVVMQAPSGQQGQAQFAYRERYYLEQLLNPVDTIDPSIEKAAEMYAARTGRKEGFVDVLEVLPATTTRNLNTARRFDKMNSFPMHTALMHDIEYKAKGLNSPEVDKLLADINSLRHQDPEKHNLRIKQIYTQALELIEDIKANPRPPVSEAELQRMRDEIESLRGEIEGAVREAEYDGNQRRIDDLEDLLMSLDELTYDVEIGNIGSFDDSIRAIRDLFKR